MWLFDGLMAAEEMTAEGMRADERAGDFGGRIAAVVDGKHTTKERADAITEWLWAPDTEGKSRIRFGRAENRLKTPEQMVDMYGVSPLGLT
jgi:hypothetical protein